MLSEKKEHWEHVYRTKNPQQVSWTQENPKTSFNYIKNSDLAKNSAIIDVGGGDSFLVDYLLKEGYTNLTVLDISEQAIERAKKRQGTLGNTVNWIVSDVLNFKPSKPFDLWHDRAAFHFLTNASEKNTYKDLVDQHVTRHLVIATFSNDGPIKCSGLVISQYNEKELTSFFQPAFQLLNSKQEDHQTPFNTIQNFQFVHLKRTS
tara:strand:+ start:10707 stop:11321 length:615 start_codon:yes stop_codon:yes gene_type:complete